jgi:hypothetical protein
MKVNNQAIKRIGASGQISLGKEFAGHTVLVNNPEPGVWLRLLSLHPDHVSAYR